MNDQQCLFIVENFDSRKNVFLNKSNSANVSKKKRLAWMEIANDFNNKFPLNHRDWNGIKKKWENMASQAKKWVSSVRQARKKTGGGPPLPEPPSYIKAIADMLGDSDAFKGVGIPMESGENPPPLDTTQMPDNEGDSVAEEALQTEPAMSQVTAGRLGLRESSTKKSAETLENLHKEVLLLEKQKLSLEIRKLQLEIEHLEWKMRQRRVDSEEDKRNFLDMDTGNFVFTD